MENKELVESILKLRKEKNALILVHNYQSPPIYDVADFIGDSLELCMKAQAADEDIIVFCGVDFMAESAKVLNPKKTVLHPNTLSKCPMANMVTPEQIQEARARNPKASVVSYINTTTEVKAVSDICCTSANAIDVVNSLQAEEVIFTPDRNLAAWVQKNTKKKIIPVEGHCYVHDKITSDSVLKAIKNHPEAKVLVHPECRPEVLDLADSVCSTSQMTRNAASSKSDSFIIVTECGMREKLQRDFPQKKFYSIGGVCIQMKKILLKDVFDSLKEMKYRIELSRGLIEMANAPLQRMISLKHQENKHK